MIRDILQFPIPNADKDQSVKMVFLVKQMLELHKQLASAKTDHDKTVIQRQIDAIDRQIDLLVYELYGLTEEEIKIVEEGSPKLVGAGLKPAPAVGLNWQKQCGNSHHFA